MLVETSLNGAKATISIAGNVTVATCSDLETAVRRVAPDAVDYDIDLSQLEYISSAGLRVLLSTQRAASEKGGVMRLLHPSDSVMEIMEMTGLSEVLLIKK